MLKETQLVEIDCSDYSFFSKHILMHDYKTLDFYDINDGVTIFVTPYVIVGGAPIVNAT